MANHFPCTQTYPFARSTSSLTSLPVAPSPSSSSAAIVVAIVVVPRRPSRRHNRCRRRRRCRSPVASPPLSSPSSSYPIASRRVVTIVDRRMATPDLPSTGSPCPCSEVAADKLCFSPPRRIERGLFDSPSMNTRSCLLAQKRKEGPGSRPVGPDEEEVANDDDDYTSEDREE